MDMPTEYYGPRADAVQRLNSLLRLPAQGDEQDWEDELADPRRIDEILEWLESGKLTFEEMSAFGLLTISSIILGSEAQFVSQVQIARLSHVMSRNDGLRIRMTTYWPKRVLPEHRALIERILAGR